MRLRPVGRTAFAAGSFLAFLPATAYGLTTAVDVASRLALQVQVPLPDESGAFPDIDPSVLLSNAYDASGTSLGGLLLSALGWAALAWLVAARCKDIGDPPALAWAVLPVAAAASLPGSPWWAAAVATLGMLVWSVRLGLTRGRMPARRGA